MTHEEGMLKTLTFALQNIRKCPHLYCIVTVKGFAIIKNTLKETDLAAMTEFVSLVDLSLKAMTLISFCITDAELVVLLTAGLLQTVRHSVIKKKKTVF